MGSWGPLDHLEGVDGRGDGDGGEGEGGAEAGCCAGGRAGLGGGRGGRGVGGGRRRGGDGGLGRRRGRGRRGRVDRGGRGRGRRGRGDDRRGGRRRGGRGRWGRLGRRGGSAAGRLRRGGHCEEGEHGEHGEVRSGHRDGRRASRLPGVLVSVCARGERTCRGVGLIKVAAFARARRGWLCGGRCAGQRRCSCLCLRLPACLHDCLCGASHRRTSQPPFHYWEVFAVGITLRSRKL
ncbi:hypothetical protein PVAP13_7NG184770 [Panicum virgatum]|uniref:Uncharacterized protein n=1 Tax=Panicum virgatum TaxID=38727 RepID=A0A8T0Q086_PANVG|nr:hypothetical protein PVAP13_7NG184770 [Panicum virgatum]